MIILGPGFLSPLTGEAWQSIACPIELQAIVCEFQLVDSSLSFSDIKSYLLFRRSFKHLGLKINDKDYRAYPSPDSSIFTIPPIPLSIANQAIESSIDCIKVIRNMPYQYVEPNWRVQFYAVI